MSVSGRRIRVRGTVQGVGFRPWVHRLASQHGLEGRVRNDAAGVTIEIFGEAPALEAFIGDLSGDGPESAAIEALACSPIPVEETRGFVISDTGSDGALQLSIPPDRATCEACLAETRDPSDRRHQHPFASCPACGPRYSIVLDAPYDRAGTTMAAFPMCEACRREYDDPSDRRFHAQPNACLQCGPRLSLRDGSGVRVVAPDALAVAATAILAGRIVAVKGLGGFHLACDATCEKAVETLRMRKGRDEKPLAVMVRDLAAAGELALVSEDERSLLSASERPIVLVPRRRDTKLADSVAPGLSVLGLFLPYTALHHRLLEAVGGPLVLTSANRAGEPILFRDDVAARGLAPLADRILTHDRRIAAPCDDSVARVVAGAPMLLRRGRGFVPRPIRVARPFARPVLGCGGDLKNAICIGVGDHAWLAPHLGDLGSLASYEALEESVLHFCRLLRVRPEIVAHDLHPEFLATRFAREYAAPQSFGVQHHHAHVASALGEHGLPGPVLALAYDGTGYGEDGAAWGGELLLADLGSFTRIASFRPLPLAGGDAAIRQVWRVALALLDDAFDGDPPLHALPLFGEIPRREVAQVRQLMATGSHAPLAHGVGRLFDAVGALLMGRSVARYEGQVALLCNELAGDLPAAPYPFAIDEGCAPWHVDMRPMTRALVGDLLADVPADRISARFHETLVAASVAIVEAASRRHGNLPVVLTGGCFQNTRLASGLRRAFSSRRKVYLHRRVPPGDGGLALGQVLVADARSRSCA